MKFRPTHTIMGLATALMLFVSCVLERSTAAQPSTTDRSGRPSSTKGTPLAKSKGLELPPVSIVGRSRTWEYEKGISDKPIYGVIVAISDGVVTLQDGNLQFHDVLIAELREGDRRVLARIERLMHNTELPDEKALLGSWREVGPKEKIEEIEEITKILDGKMIIDGVEMIGSGTMNDGRYSLDPTKTPKQIDIGIDLGDPLLTRTGIYELKGDELRICLNRSSVPAVPPTKFETDEKRLIRTFRRLPNVMTLAPAKSQDVDPEIRRTLEELIAHAEEGRTSELLQRAIPPAELAQFPTEQREMFLDYMRQTRGRRLLELKSLLRVVPKLNAEKTEATFDFSDVTLDDQLNTPKNMHKLDGKWYLGPPRPKR